MRHTTRIGIVVWFAAAFLLVPAVTQAKSVTRTQRVYGTVYSYWGAGLQIRYTAIDDPGLTDADGTSTNGHYSVRVPAGHVYRVTIDLYAGGPTCAVCPVSPGLVAVGNRNLRVDLRSTGAGS